VTTLDIQSKILSRSRDIFAALIQDVVDNLRLGEEGDSRPWDLHWTTKLLEDMFG